MIQTTTTVGVWGRMLRETGVDDAVLRNLLEDPLSRAAMIDHIREASGAKEPNPFGSHFTAANTYLLASAAINRTKPICNRDAANFYSCFPERLKKLVDQLKNLEELAVGTIHGINQACGPVPLSVAETLSGVPEDRLEEACTLGLIKLGLLMAIDFHQYLYKMRMLETCSCSVEEVVPLPNRITLLLKRLEHNKLTDMISLSPQQLRSLDGIGEKRAEVIEERLSWIKA